MTQTSQNTLSGHKHSPSLFASGSPQSSEDTHAQYTEVDWWRSELWRFLAEEVDARTHPVHPSPAQGYGQWLMQALVRPARHILSPSNSSKAVRSVPSRPIFPADMVRHQPLDVQMPGNGQVDFTTALSNLQRAVLSQPPHEPVSILLKSWEGLIGQGCCFPTCSGIWFTQCKKNRVLESY